MAAILIIATACLMFFSLHFRKKIRENQKHLHIPLENCEVYFKASKIAGFVHISLRAEGDFFKHCPPIISCVLMDDAYNKIMSIPNFWLNNNGLSFIKAEKINGYCLNITIYHKRSKVTSRWKIWSE